MRLNQSQEKIRSNFSDATKVEMDRFRKELAKSTRNDDTLVKHNGTSSVKRTVNISTTWKKETTTRNI